MNRNDVTEMIVAAKIQKGIKWADVAEKIGLSKEWVTAGCLGQMTFNATQAGLLGEIFALPSEALCCSPFLTKDRFRLRSLLTH